MMQFINTFTGVRTSCVCELVWTLFSATTKKNGKGGLASETILVSGVNMILPFTLYSVS